MKENTIQVLVILLCILGKGPHSLCNSFSWSVITELALLQPIIKNRRCPKSQQVQSVECLNDEAGGDVRLTRCDCKLKQQKFTKKRTLKRSFSEIPTRFLTPYREFEQLQRPQSTLVVGPIKQLFD
jgi:hypothetical protein